MSGLRLNRRKGERVVCYDPSNPDRKIEVIVNAIHKGEGAGSVELAFLDPDHNFKVLRGELAQGGIR